VGLGSRFIEQRQLMADKLASCLLLEPSLRERLDVDIDVSCAVLSDVLRQTRVWCLDVDAPKLCQRISRKFGVSVLQKLIRLWYPTRLDEFILTSQVEWYASQVVAMEEDEQEYFRHIVKAWQLRDQWAE
jgi:hypothetical protein